jgi:hypothetical protein
VFRVGSCIACVCFFGLDLDFDVGVGLAQSLLGSMRVGEKEGGNSRTKKTRRKNDSTKCF